MKGKKKNETFSEDSVGVNPVEESGKVAETIEENTPVGDEFAILYGKDAIAIQQKKPKILAISKASVIISVVVVVLLIIASIVLAYTLPLGQYERSTDADGNVYISGDYHEDPSLGRLPWWKVLLSPFLVLGGSGTLTLVAILFMLVVIGAVFSTRWTKPTCLFTWWNPYAIITVISDIFCCFCCLWRLCFSARRRA